MGTFISRKEQPLTTCILHCPRNQTTAECSCQALVYGFVCLFFYFFLREMTGRTSLTFPIPFCLSSPSGVGNTAQPHSAEQQHLFRAFSYSRIYPEGEWEREAVWVKFALWMHVLVLKWDCSGGVQRVFLALNQTPFVGGIPAPTLDGAMQEGNPLNAAAGQSSTPWYFQQKI